MTVYSRDVLTKNANALGAPRLNMSHTRLHAEDLLKLAIPAIYEDLERVDDKRQQCVL